MNRAALVAALALGLASSPAGHAASPVVHTERAEDLERGRAEGMATTRRGLLFQTPRPEPFGSPFPGAGPAQIWSIAADGNGGLYLGTGPPGQVLKVSPAGESTLLFETEQPMVTALATTRGGELLAAAAPGGVIYRIDHDGRGEVWSETDELYVWALAQGEGDRIYAATGERGRILEIGPSGRADTFFDGDESHIVSLVALPGGELLAGGAGRGLIYRIDREGHALILHDDDLPEVVALAPAGDAVVAALLAPPEPEQRRPALQLRLPDSVQAQAPSEAAGVLEEEAGPMLHGVIEGIPRTADRPAERVRGRLIRIAPTGEATELWNSTREAPFCLFVGDPDRVWFGAGEPARLYRIAPDGDVERTATMLEAQLISILEDSVGVVLTTANPARIYRLSADANAPGEFLSRPIDAGGPARWGSIRWTPVDLDGTEFYTRTGNSRSPDSSWSAWSPALRDGTGSAVINPDGRFLQWRVRQSGRGGSDRAIAAVEVVFEPYNRPPRLDRFRAEPSATRPGESLVLRWEADDPDADGVEVTVEYRAAVAGNWDLAGTVSMRPRVDETTDEPDEGRLIWEIANVEDGVYRLRATASDQPSNPYGEGLASIERPLVEVVVDRRPPRIDLRPSGDGSFEVLLEDELSDLRPLQLILDGRVRHTARPLDGVADSRRERFRVELPSGAGEGWSIRGSDSAGNSVDRSIGIDEGAE